MSVKARPISRTASLLIIAVGVFTLLGGWAAGIFEDEIAGVAFIILGLVLFALLYRLERRA